MIDDAQLHPLRRRSGTGACRRDSRRRRRLWIGDGDGVHELVGVTAPFRCERERLQVLGDQAVFCPAGRCQVAAEVTAVAGAAKRRGPRKQRPFRELPVRECHNKVVECAEALRHGRLLLAFPLLLVGGLFLLTRRNQGGGGNMPGGMGGPGGNNPMAFGKSSAGKLREEADKFTDMDGERKFLIK